MGRRHDQRGVKGETLTIRPAGPHDLPAAETLLRAYPYKILQRRRQRLDHERLIAFYLSGIRSALERGATHWIALRGERPVALAGLHADAFHAGVFGMPMAKLQPWLATVEAAVAPPLLSAVEGAARASGIRHLSVRVDGEGFDSLQTFERAGWLTVDVSLKYSRPLPLRRRRAAAPPADGGWTIGEATPADAEWIQRLGSRTHGGTHFLNDPALPPDRTRALFEQWLARCLGGLAWHVSVLRDSAGEGRGFVTWLRSGAFARALDRRPLILDFILIDPALRGSGLGLWLAEEGIARACAAEPFDYCELRTSAHNLPAVAAYEKLGFKLVATDYTLHRRL